MDGNILLLHFCFYESIAKLMFDNRNIGAPCNILQLFEDISNVHFYNTSSSVLKTFYTKSSSLSALANSFYRVGAQVWNEMSLTIRNLSKNSFRRNTKKTLINPLGLKEFHIDLHEIIQKVKVL